MLFLDARLAKAVAQRAGDILFQETGSDPQVAAFSSLADAYLRLPE